VLVNLTTGQVLATRVELCNTFWSKLRGLMFRRSLDPDHALVFSHARESIAETSIHMLFVSFPIAVIWLNARKQVVGRALAKPYRPYYASQVPAQYFIEGVPDLLERARIGDQIAFEECTG
jgi:uncharacterized membrane protein (UPF0127 family)